MPCRIKQELKGGLKLDTRQSARLGGDSGAAVVPFDLTKSLIVAAVRYEGLEMPPEAKLPPDEIEVIERWIQLGAPDPRNAPASPSRNRFDPVKARQWWSLQPIADPALPKIANQAWPHTSVDYFVLSKLEQAKLNPAHAADRIDWLRRVHYDLCGLPPAWN